MDFKRYNPNYLQVQNQSEEHEMPLDLSLPRQTTSRQAQAHHEAQRPEKNYILYEIVSPTSSPRESQLYSPISSPVKSPVYSPISSTPFSSDSPIYSPGLEMDVFLETKARHQLSTPEGVVNCQNTTPERRLKARRRLFTPTNSKNKVWPNCNNKKRTIRQSVSTTVTTPVAESESPDIVKPQNKRPRMESESSEELSISESDTDASEGNEPKTDEPPFMDISLNEEDNSSVQNESDDDIVVLEIISHA